MSTDTAVAENPRAVIGGNKPPSVREFLTERFAAYPVEIDEIAERANKSPKEIASDADLGTVGDIVKDARKLAKRLDKDRAAEKEPHLSAGREVDAFFKAMLDRVDRIATVLQQRADAYQCEKAAEARRKAEAEQRAAQEEADRQRRIAEEEAARNRPMSAASHADKAEALEDKAASAAAQATASAADLTRIRSESGGTVVTAQTRFAFEITDFAKVDLEALRPYLPRADVEKAIRAFVRVNKDGTPLAGVRIFPETKAAFR